MLGRSEPWPTCRALTSCELKLSCAAQHSGDQLSRAPARRRRRQMPNMNVDQMVKELSDWKVADVAALVKALEEEWGVSAAPAAVAVAGGAGGDAPAAEEKTEFDVELTEAGGKKIQVIKAIREITSWVWPTPRTSWRAPRRSSRRASPRTRPRRSRRSSRTPARRSPSSSRCERPLVLCTKAFAGTSPGSLSWARKGTCISRPRFRARAGGYDPRGLAPHPARGVGPHLRPRAALRLLTLRSD